MDDLTVTMASVTGCRWLEAHWMGQDEIQSGKIKISRYKERKSSQQILFSNRRPRHSHTDGEANKKPR